MLAGGYLVFTDATFTALFPGIKGNLTSNFHKLYDWHNHFSAKRFYSINLGKCSHYLINKSVLCQDSTCRNARTSVINTDLHSTTRNLKISPWKSNDNNTLRAHNSHDCETGPTVMSTFQVKEPRRRTKPVAEADLKDQAVDPWHVCLLTLDYFAYHCLVLL